jgi:hypothetical protein
MRVWYGGQVLGHAVTARHEGQQHREEREQREAPQGLQSQRQHKRLLEVTESILPKLLVRMIWRGIRRSSCFSGARHFGRCCLGDHSCMLQPQLIKSKATSAIPGYPTQLMSCRTMCLLPPVKGNSSDAQRPWGLRRYMPRMCVHGTLSRQVDTTL